MFSILSILIGMTILSASNSTGQLGVPLAENLFENSSNLVDNVTNWSSLRGVDYHWTTVVDPNETLSSAPAPSISFPEIKASGWNLLRVTFFWGEYRANPSQYISNVQTIAWYAEQNGLYVIWDLNHGDK